MQLIYAAPFVFLALIGYLCCLILPSWRRYALYALVAPPGFAAGSFVGLFGIALISEGVDHPTWWIYVVLVALYFGSGSMGAWIAMQIVDRLKSRRAVRRDDEIASSDI